MGEITKDNPIKRADVEAQIAVQRDPKWDANNFSRENIKADLILHGASAEAAELMLDLTMENIHKNIIETAEHDMQRLERLRVSENIRRAGTAAPQIPKY